jgi:GNAT superfamily N-acetyltransferase
MPRADSLFERAMPRADSLERAMESANSLEHEAVFDTSDHRLVVDTVVHLDETHRDAMRDHFVALSSEDRRLRFGSPLATRAVIEYVDGIDFERDVLLGLQGANGALIGIAHVAFSDDGAELGISVLPGYRRRGAGSALFAGAVEQARGRNVSRVYMHCLSENAAMMHIARRAGMKIVVSAGDADAHLALPAGEVSRFDEKALLKRIALYDWALRALARIAPSMNVD